MPAALTTGLWISMSAVFGLLVGSFLNVCIYRLPAGLTIVRGHSFCPSCHHDLSAPDLVPVLSFLLLGRRCRYCSQPIASRYMWIELLTGAYFALVASIWRPGTIDAPAWLLAISGQTADFHATLLLLIAAALAFSGLLVWAMINWDGQEVPTGVFIFTLFPALLRLAIQPERLISHLSALLLAVLVVVFIGLIRLVPWATCRKNLGLAIGVILISLAGGLFVAQAVLAVVLAELLLLVLLGRRTKPITKQASLLWRSMPLQALLIGSVLWLLL